MRLVGPLLVATLVAGLLPSAALGQSPSVAPSPSASPVPIPVVGPDTEAEPPDQPIGPQPWLTLDVPMDAITVRAVRCDHGLVVMASGRDRLNRPITRFWRSDDGVDWTAGPTLRPEPAERRTWGIDDLTWFRNHLVAVGEDDRHLAVWRSTDCGMRWTRERDPSFALGADAIGLTQGAEIAATADRLLVIGRQGGEGIPRDQWAWWYQPGSGWHRIAGGLEAEDIDGPTADRSRFWTVQFDAAYVPRVLQSAGGVEWTDVGDAPDLGLIRIERPSERLLMIGFDQDAEAPSAVVWASQDGMDWAALAQSGPTQVGWGSTITGADGVLVWTVDAEAPVAGDWSWIGTSTDDGATWSVSAGWPDLAFTGAPAVAIADRAIIAVSVGDGVRVWTLAR